MQYYYRLSVCEWMNVCVSVQCHMFIVYANELQFSMQALIIVVTFLQTQADACIGKYMVLFITIVTFYNVFFYHILYVRNNIKSHFQI